MSVHSLFTPVSQNKTLLSFTPVPWHHIWNSLLPSPPINVQLILKFLCPSGLDSILIGPVGRWCILSLLTSEEALGLALPNEMYAEVAWSWGVSTCPPCLLSPIREAIIIQIKAAPSACVFEWRWNGMALQLPCDRHVVLKPLRCHSPS